MIKFTSCLRQGRWFSPASSTTKTGRHDIAEILLKVALNTKNSNSNSFIIKHNYFHCPVIVISCVTRSVQRLAFRIHKRCANDDWLRLQKRISMLYKCNSVSITLVMPQPNCNWYLFHQKPYHTDDIWFSHRVNRANIIWHNYICKNLKEIVFMLTNAWISHNIQKIYSLYHGAQKNHVFTS